ncbi:S1 family peptidase [Streptomyces sp. NPDC050504]|uniref:S1 family peptidase n=1 Tax=Streptomyces sp. NPDC050504 TaxID=3365618 RepID=UPI0037A2D672
MFTLTRRSTAVALAAATLGTAALAAATPAAAVHGGKNATTADHPYIMAIRSTSGEQICGGTLVAPTKVVTAAHCVDNEDGSAKKFKVIGGRTEVASTKGTVRNIASIKIHPQYVSAAFTYDAAVITLDKPMPYKVLPVAGPRDGALYKSGTSATALGWGLTATDTLATRLKSARLVLSPLKSCEPYTQPDDKSSLKLCTTPAAGTKDSICRGDSGGPLIVGGKLVGILSTGNKYCNKDFPTGLFTRVSAISAKLSLPTG